MIYTFSACGHKNILAAHKTTLEFTKEKELSLNGDCIVGVNSDFDCGALKKFIKNNSNKKVLITIKVMKKGKVISEKFSAVLNPSFNDEKEIVMRKSDFTSSRTLAVRSEKAAADFGKGFIRMIKEPSSRMIIELSSVKDANHIQSLGDIEKSSLCSGCHRLGF